jgi:hypothetical protein
MNFIYSTRHWLKVVRWRARRAAIALRWGPQTLATTPCVLGNAMPKSGSHLINQVVQGLPRLGPFVSPGFPPVNRDEVNDKLPDTEVLANLKMMRPGDIGYGYIKAHSPFIELLTQSGRATIFVCRDPRDMIISHVFYATQMHTGHGMHRYYNETLHTMEQRIEAAIQGVDEPGSELSPILAKYEGYLGWLEQPAVLCLRFEDLILDRQKALNQLLDYLNTRGFKSVYSRQQEIDVLQQAIAPKKSGTFRKGQPGNWREHFTPANIAFFKEQTGDLLMRLGYEISADW